MWALLPLLASGGASAAEFGGAGLGVAWSFPFVGILLSIALCPLLVPMVWHHHFGKIAAGWSLAILVPLAVVFGPRVTLELAAHTLMLEYVPFIIVIFALYTVAGGICVRGNLHGTPQLNTVLLAIGTFLAGWMGTTGAAMLMIRPVIRANDNRKHKTHVIVFFIFLVANAGGALTPLGDPPLFLGFLKGVDFFWPTKHLLVPTAVLCGVLLLVFFVLDWYFYHHRGEEKPSKLDPTPDSPLRIEGKINFLLLLGVLGAVLLSGVWQPKLELHPARQRNRTAERRARRAAHRDRTGVARPHACVRARRQRLQLGADPRGRQSFSSRIFLTIVPVIAILRAGPDGALGGVVRLVTDDSGAPINAMYFWLTGALSSFLDNAPTYLVFFNLAGGDADVLMTTLAKTLAALSAGAVFMGAMTYIGNAPNFMVKAIAEQSGIRMPSFFGYMAWSCAVLLPAFVLLTLLFFR